MLIDRLKLIAHLNKAFEAFEDKKRSANGTPVFMEQLIQYPSCEGEITIPTYFIELLTRSQAETVEITYPDKNQIRILEPSAGINDTVHIRW